MKKLFALILTLTLVFAGCLWFQACREQARRDQERRPEGFL